MATLTVTFTRGFPNVFATQAGGVAVGKVARSEVITLPATTSLQSAAAENIVELTADADCWVAIGTAPDAGANTAGERDAHFIKSGLPYQYWIDETGTKVAAEV